MWMSCRSEHCPWARKSSSPLTLSDKTYVGTVTRVSMKGSSSGGTTTYPITIRIDNTDGLPSPARTAAPSIAVAVAEKLSR